MNHITIILRASSGAICKCIDEKNSSHIYSVYFIAIRFLLFKKLTFWPEGGARGKLKMSL